MSKGWVGGYDIYDDRGKDGGVLPSFREKKERENAQRLFAKKRTQEA